MKHLFYLFTLCIALIACSSDEGSDTPALPAMRTVIAFISGDNNLADSLNSDYKEMITGSASLSKDVNLIVVCDVMKDKPFVAKIAGGAATTVRQWQDEFFMTNPDSMLSIMQWIINKYPAKEYATIFAGHGNGSRQMNDTIQTDMMRLYAYGVDYNTSSSTDGKWINVPTLATVLSNLKTPEGERLHQEFIFFDCCNMQTIENVYELRNYTDYISAPLSEVKSEGANYREVVPLLSYDFASDPSQLLFYGDNQKLCTSVVDTRNLENLLTATYYVLHEIRSNDPESSSTTLRYQGSIYYSYIHNPFLHDMQNVLLNHVENGTLSDATFQVWKECLEDVVVAKKMTPRWTTAVNIDFSSFTVDDNTYGGLSMIVPRYGYDYSSPYHGSTEPLINTYMYDYEWCRKVGWNDLGW